VAPFGGSIAVLVNEDSASASEIIANALREAKRSPIVGEPTAGAVLMSTFEQLPYGFRIQFPVSDYVSVGGKRLESNPIRPDVVLSKESVKTEAAVDAALARMR
ncbi:MAG TPA: S41 family peptidase, partial [Fimbriimonas sp.]